MELKGNGVQPRFGLRFRVGDLKGMATKAIEKTNFPSAYKGKGPYGVAASAAGYGSKLTGVALFATGHPVMGVLAILVGGCNKLIGASIVFRNRQGNPEKGENPLIENKIKDPT